MISRIEERNKRFFTLWSSLYDHGPIKWWLASVQKKVPGIIADSAKKNKAILDIGCGTGDLLLFLAKRFKDNKIYGVDITRAMLDIARNRLRKHKNVRLVEAGADKLPFKDGQFEIVATTDSFHHFPNAEKALAEMRRVLKKNGKIILIDVNFGFIASELFCMLEPGCIKIYSKRDFRRLLEQAGFRVLGQKRVGLFAICNTAMKD